MFFSILKFTQSILQKRKEHFQTTLWSLMKRDRNKWEGGMAWLFLQKLINRGWNKPWEVQELKEYRFSTLKKKKKSFRL